MLGKILEKILGTNTFKIITIIGGIGAIKYGYDSIEELMQKKKSVYDQEQISKIELTDKDREILQKFSKKDLTEEEMKELKYVILQKRKDQKLSKKIEKYSNDFNIDIGDNLYKDEKNKESLKPKNKD